MPRTWLEPQEVSVPAELTSLVGGHPLVAQTLVRRGITTPAAARAFLDPASYQPASPTELPGLDEAAALLVEPIRQHEPICVWGDFDVDGQTATTVLVSTLRALGANVTFHIPVREREGHGVNLPVLREVLQGGAKVILTCDTGITAHEAAEFGRDQGAVFIITDHHDLPPTLPQAHAIVNPKLLPESHPLYTLPGVGVAYKLAEELCNRIQPESFQVSSLVDLAALGIVADVATQTGEARYLVQRGLETLRKTQRLGLKALMESAELNPDWLTEEHIGFVIGPRLNALGRLADANLSVEFLTTQDLGRARVIATTLEGLNARRQMLTSQVFRAAQAQIEREPALLEEPALVLWQPTWPAGVIGIVASRLVEHYNRPVVLLASPPGELARGSARSVAGCNITAAIAEQKELLASFGGHPMAAGLSLEAEHLPEFRQGLTRSIRRMIGEAQPESSLQLDGYLSLSEISLNLVEDFQRLAPFGAGNPALVLVARSLSLVKHTFIGRGDEHLQLIVEDEAGNTQKVLWWQGGGWLSTVQNTLQQGRFDLAFTVRASDYRGARDIQVEWIDARLLEPSTAAKEPAKRIESVDYRHQAHPLAILKQLLAEKEIQVWCEAEARQKLSANGIKGRTRLELIACPRLAIWTTPPGPGELKEALKLSEPDVVYIFGVNPETTEMQAFLQRLAGLVKYALSQQAGQVTLATLVAATAQRESVVLIGLDWLERQGIIHQLSESDGLIKLIPGDRIVRDDLELIRRQLEAMLDETKAYRTYFGKVSMENMISSFD